MSGLRATFRDRWPLLATILLYAAVASWKTSEFESHPRYGPASDRLLFWTESAFHYRYARMVAEGDAIPAHDRAAQMPEGLDVFRHITPASMSTTT